MVKKFTILKTFTNIFRTTLLDIDHEGNTGTETDFIASLKGEKGDQPVFDDTQYATAAQGTKADGALPKSGGAMTGAITTNSTFDGRDVSADGTKLDGIEASADVTDATNVTSAGALMDSEVTDLAGIKGVTISTLQVKPSEGAFANGKLLLYLKNYIFPR